MPTTQVIHCPAEGCDYQVTVEIGMTSGTSTPGTACACTTSTRTTKRSPCWSAVSELSAFPTQADTSALAPVSAARV